MVSTVWDADGFQKRSGLCARKESLLVIDAVNSGLVCLENYCMYGPTALHTSCLPFDKCFWTFWLRHRQCHLRKLSLSRYRVWSVYVVPQVFLCRVSLCYFTYIYIVYVVNNYAHTIPHSHAALFYFCYSLLFSTALAAFPSSSAFCDTHVVLLSAMLCVLDAMLFSTFTLVLLAMMSFGCFVRLGCYAIWLYKLIQTII